MKSCHSGLEAQHLCNDVPYTTTGFSCRAGNGLKKNRRWNADFQPVNCIIEADKPVFPTFGMRGTSCIKTRKTILNSIINEYLAAHHSQRHYYLQHINQRLHP
jgi:hypothetical protein